MTKNINRREFLLVTSVLIEAAFLGLPNIALASGEALDLSALPSRFGEFYLKQNPSEKDLDVLRRLLHFDNNSSLAPADLKELLLKDIHLDYESGRILRFEGWVLSQTEGRLCAFKGMESSLDVRRLYF